ncbi:phosphonate C-P lyase system protein PhnH [Celerinatantimonas yamalensis]|uniref:Phosphonate C-P lyase system protein PhnH n=1 Tax=Celerinatantimonas yamalensis TaxID=559956 RepID=A0ABW9G8V2_9GAMM
MSFLQQGFREPVFDAQHCFRQILTAMSEPGRIVKLDRSNAIGVLHRASIALCLTLLDRATPLWIGESLQSAVVAQNLRFHCNVAQVSDPAQAEFILTDHTSLPDLMSLPVGTMEYPDQGSTLWLQVDALGQPGKVQGTHLQLRGPGIETQRELVVDLLAAPVLDYLTKRPHAFPLGLDIVFICDTQIAAIPRITHVEVLSCMSQ